METEIAEVFMNPVRQRIIQYLLVHEKGTVKEMKKVLSDIPNASLYRHRSEERRVGKECRL